MVAESTATRAVISGRRTYEHANRWNGTHHDGVPVLVLTHHVPEEPPLIRELNADDTDPAHRVLHLRYRVQRPSPTPDAGGNG